MSNLNKSFDSDQSGRDETIQILPKYIVVPHSLMFEASTAIEKYNQTVMDYNKLYVVTEPRLTGFNGWFLVCDNSYPSIGFMTLQGETTPQIIQSSKRNTFPSEAWKLGSLNSN